LGPGQCCNLSVPRDTICVCSTPNLTEKQSGISMSQDTNKHLCHGLTLDMTALTGYTSDIHQSGVCDDHEDSEMGQQSGIAYQ